jgi:ActR/RegA family two-component response regulator
LPTDIALVVNGDNAGATVSGEAGQLQQVVLNLCNNAAQATTAPGQVTLDWRAVYNPQTTALSHGEIAPGHYVRIAVSDKGRGMSAATLSRVFEPFFTTRVNGHGLGLATVHEIVRDHNGVMHVTSAPGVGSRFEVWLPLAAAASLQESEARQIFGQGETVMVVNEDQDGLLRDEETLAALGYEPIGFTSTAAALAACKDEPTRFDVLLVSNVSPGPAAVALAADIHECAPSLAILLATRFTKEIDTEALAKAGVLEMLQQPLLSSDLANALGRTLATDRPLGRPVRAT